MGRRSSDADQPFFSAVGAVDALWRYRVVGFHRHSELLPPSLPSTQETLQEWAALALESPGNPFGAN